LSLSFAPMPAIANVDSKPPPEMYVTNVLLVEDDSLIASTVALALQEEGYTIQHAANGQEALALLCIRDMNLEDNIFSATSSGNKPNHEFNLIVLDIMLPHLNGLDICRILRRQGDTTPILMLSARSSEIDRVLGLEVGADDYLSKPFGMKEFIARCRALLRRPVQFGSSSTEKLVLTYGDIVLDVQEHRVLVRNAEIMLTPKEFLLLETLMRSPRQVFSREQLLQKVWGTDYGGESKTVDVHMRWLREKLELDPSQPEYLITVRGFGYRLGGK
jgi:two-component system, OmpR family, phosphate regulon response regulator PhoB